MLLGVIVAKLKDPPASSVRGLDGFGSISNASELIARVLGIYGSGDEELMFATMTGKDL